MANETLYELLLAADGSEHAERAAEYIARFASRLAPCEAFVVNVQPLTSSRAYAFRHDEIALEACEQGTAATAVARKYLEDAGVSYRFHVELGDPAACIVDQAAAHKCDEIVLGTRGLATGDFGLGSVAYKVIHLSRVPVTVVGHLSARASSSAEDEVHRVLLAVDGSENAAHATEYVCKLRASRLPVDVQLVNVQLPVPGNIRNFVPHEVIDTCYREEGDAALHSAKQALSEAGLEFESHVMAGAVAETIAHLAKSHNCTRIVMGTRGLGALGNLVLGSVAYKVVQLAPVPVTLVK